MKVAFKWWRCRSKVKPNCIESFDGNVWFSVELFGNQSNCLSIIVRDGKWNIWLTSGILVDSKVVCLDAIQVRISGTFVNRWTGSRQFAVILDPSSCLSRRLHQRLSPRTWNVIFKNWKRNAIFSHLTITDNSWIQLVTMFVPKNGQRENYDRQLISRRDKIHTQTHF